MNQRTNKKSQEISVQVKEDVISLKLTSTGEINKRTQKRLEWMVVE